MSLEASKRQIGDHEYTVTMLDAMTGRRVFTRFAKVITPVLAETAKTVGGNQAKLLETLAAGKKDGGEAVAKTSPELVILLVKTFGNAISTLFEHVSEDDIDYFCDSFAPATSVRITDDDGKTKNPQLSKVFSLHFAGNYDLMLEWLAFCFEVNFASFFRRLGLAKSPATGTPTPSL